MGQLELATTALGERRAKVARAWDLRGAVALVPAGLPPPIAGTDQSHDFHAHPDHYYLSGLGLAGGVLAFDPAEGWVAFERQATQDEKVWEGETPALEELSVHAGIPVRPAGELQAWLERRRGERVALLGNHDIERRTADYGIDGWAALEVDLDEGLAARLTEQVAEARRTKDAAELARMREAGAASVEGHLAGWRVAREGMTERQLQVEIEAEMFRHGPLRTAYGSIVGAGPNSAVLHFRPTARELRDGDMVLVDAGAEVEGYAADVTRTFPVGRRFEGLQGELYDLVLAA
ncbi:MAG: aminopeptidase P N-terminal domain-containing protein, partial [Dehalococcoidia bacterium]